MNASHMLRVYAVTDRSWLNGRSFEEVLREALSAGVTGVQLREKQTTTEEKEELARTAQTLCAEFGVPFLINDDVALAKKIDADGVHIGQSDCSCQEARAILGKDAIIGVTAKTLDQALKAEADGASYLGVGAVFPTSTKTDTQVISRETLKEICQAVSIPVVAIGGISAENARELAGTGIAGIAAVSAIFAQPDIKKAVQELAAVSNKVAGTMKSVVTIAGSDSSGGAGIQADLKTMTALGVFGQSAITALTAQNTTGVLGVVEADPDFLALQLKAIFEDIRPDAVKIGMVANPELIETIACQLKSYDAENIVLDPVMVATSGSSLASDGVAQALVEHLFPLAEVVTPNLTEAEVFSGIPISQPAHMLEAAKKIQQLGAKAVLVKGGHLENLEDTETATFEEGRAYDLLLDEDGIAYWLHEPRIATENTHGTGCTLSSAIASYLAKGDSLVDAIKNAKYYLTQALAHDLHLGKASGPVNHCWNI